MCLAIPGKVVELHELNGMRMAKVDFGGITREACLEYVPETKLGENEYLVIGDNRTMDIGSHFFTVSGRHELIGKLLF